MVGTAGTTDEKVMGKNYGTKQHLRIISYDNSKHILHVAIRTYVRS